MNKTNLSGDPVLEVEHLSISYKTRRGWIPAVRDVSFQIGAGETLGLVGESGCGKSTVAFSLVNFLGSNGRIAGGSIRFEGSELVGRSRRELNRLRGNRISMVYQNPMSALNPTLRIGEQLMEVLTCHQTVSKTEAWDRAVAMLRRVYMPDADQIMARYPHQLSGGQQQRVVIAMAMLNHPALLIMDEPTTALDVTVEAAVLDLVEDLKQEFQTSILFITHNLGVVARVSDRLCVMYAGEMVEQGQVDTVFAHPAHPYTRGLLRCVPRLGSTKRALALHPIPGRVPAPLERPENACVFAPRCAHAGEACLQEKPAWIRLPSGHGARCVMAENLAQKPLRLERRSASLKAPEAEETAEGSPLLQMREVKVYYEQRKPSLKSLLGLGDKEYVRAVDGVSLRVPRGRTLGIVGESGCGKSSLLKAVIGLERLSGGRLEFLGLDIAKTVRHRDFEVIREIQMVFQNPDATLNPSYSVGKQIARPIRRFRTVPKGQVRSEVIRLLKAVRLGPEYYDRYPRQLSGGEKQRVGIARALASRPDLVLCDEPVSALDVSVQAAVLNLLMEIQEELGTTLLFIAHDLSVVRYFTDDVAVMYLGQIMERGPAEAIYAPPYHPYTEALLSAVPIPDPSARQKRIRLGGNVPSALNPPSGCRFHTRCPRCDLLGEKSHLCREKMPPWRQVDEDHFIACHIPVEDLRGLDPVIHQVS
ncbi:peptide/nickel transport system ATP-binding protein [Desulfacinum hydrothermale DSM 13146]|uniref:Peptide/nickel transport system ATP-binding protein n=1 Tax=Desulfacinum hydrothermale DSM 13146 TaxID=1121390 RepID=A0A1W1X9T0_9BACT|nr:ABC transporter ATP-binding protein [Desulfacinum hydrothermale]SMC20281.1 peptide/nickel transport system ATP-binding protein [Desulfacinum hydrothermale DSM 13146]